jgi:hypothetical protein
VSDPVAEIEQLQSIEGLQLMIADKLVKRVGDKADLCAEDTVCLLRAIGMLPWTPTPIRTCAELREEINRV